MAHFLGIDMLPYLKVGWLDKFTRKCYRIASYCFLLDSSDGNRDMAYQVRVCATLVANVWINGLWGVMSGWLYARLK
jgi:hypothetical protein